MTTRLSISSAQVTALAKGAAKANCVAEVKIGETVVRLTFLQILLAPIVAACYVSLSAREIRK